MKRLTTRQYAILTQLIENDEFINSDQLSILVGAASKTIRKDIEQMIPRMYKEYGVDIESKSGIGFYLHRNDSDKFKRFIADFHNAYQSIYPYTNNDYRMHYLMQRLLSANDYIKINDLCEEIYSSRTIITSTLKTIRQIFADYDLIVEQTPNYGLIVTGKERNKRICLINEYMYYQAMQGTIYEVKDYHDLVYVDEKTYQIIRDSLYDFLKSEKNYIISNHGSKKVILAIILMITRKRYSSNTISFTGEEIFETYHTFSYSAAKQLLDDLSKKLNIEVSKEDTTFIAIIMLGFRNILNYQEVHVKKRLDEGTMIIEGALSHVATRTGVQELLYDQRLKEQLGFHMISMKVRYEYNLIIDYISGDLVNKKCPIAVEYAVLCCDYIEKQTDIPINRCEVMYMAYLFMAALSRIEKSYSRDNKVALIATIGRDVALTIAETVFNRYPRFVRQVDAFEVYQQHLIDERNYDYILTDLPFDSFQAANGKLIHFEYRLKENDFLTIRRLYNNLDNASLRYRSIFREDLFFHLNISGTPNEIIHEIAECIRHKLGHMEGLENDIRIRNRMTPLENSNNIAFFKTLENYRDTSFAAVFFLDKPMIWFRESVQCFIMLSVGKNEKEDILLFQEPFAEFLNNNKAMLRMLEVPTYDNFIECLLTAI